MNMIRGLIGACLLLLAGVAEAQAGPARRLAAIERASGGRLGVALIDSRGRALLSHRADERFAMCSTFKLLLGAMHAQTAGARDPMNFTRAELLPNSPFSERMLGRLEAGEMRVGFAAEHAITVSDNTAANLLLRRMGGPEAFTARLRALGDTVTRLDRYEMELNENRRGDARDTTSPAAMARSSAGFLLDVGDDPWARILRGWTIASRTGLNRIRAGLPAGWEAGDKTGSCGTAYNDVAWFRTPAGNEFLLAVYLDRPRGNAARAEAAIADVGRLASTLVH